MTSETVQELTCWQTTTQTVTTENNASRYRLSRRGWQQGGDWKCRTGKWRTKVQGWKMPDWKMTDKSARWEYRCYHQQI